MSHPTRARLWLATALILLMPCTVRAVDVLTQHNDTSRTGANLSETILTTANVNQSTFGKVFSYTVNGNVYAQPLYVSQYNFGGSIGTRNAVIIATENNVVYAFDADNRPVTGSNPQIWSVSFGAAATNGNGGCGDLSPTVGITGTPVIDKTNGIIYLVSKTFISNVYANQLHALSLVDGSEKPNSPVTISGTFPGTSGTVTFNPQYQFNRPGLLLVNGRVYAAFGSHCDQGTYQGWIFGYTTSNLAATPVIYCTSPNGNQGAIWQSGNGLVADSANNIYCATGNGVFSGGGTTGDKGMALLKLSSTLALSDFFINKDAAAQSGGDEDFGSGGPLLIPGTTRLVQAGKPGIVYLCDTGNLGGFNASSDNCAEVISGANSLQECSDGNAECPVYWNGPGGPMVYYFAGRNANNFARAYHYNTGTNLLDAAPASVSTITQGGRAGGSSLSANGATNGILWTIKSDSGGNSPPGPGRLMALDATNLTTLLWDSQQNSARDSLGNYAKLSYPTIANGNVYVNTLNASDNTNTVVVYGLLAARVATSLAFLTQPTTTTAATTMSPVQVEVLDQYGQLMTTATTSITLALGANPGVSTLGGTLTVAAVNGVATYSDLSVSNGGTGYTLVASSGVGGATSSAFTVNGAGFVAAPVFSLPTRTYSGPVTVTITDSDGAAVIHYTTNGTTPSGSSTSIASGGTVVISSTATLKAVAIRGGNASAVTSATLTISGGTPYGMPARGTLPTLTIPASGASTTTTLSATGLFADTANMVPASGIVPYNVNSPLWSDGALKQRWAALPNGATITFAATGEWTWPTGTVLVKFFALDTGAGIRRLETRVTVVTGTNIGYGLTYKWRSDNSDADLIATAGLDEVIPLASGSQTWHYPSRSECLQCHVTSAGFVLGPKTRQLNGNFAYPSSSTSDNQLRTWNYLQMFSSDIGEANIPTFTRTVSILDTTAHLEDRVKSYFDSNCGQCHRPGGSSGANWDARYDTPMASMGLINIDPIKGNLGVTGAKLVLPFNVPLSIVSLRMHSVDNLTKMPPLARNLVDTQAVAVVDQWIGNGAVDAAGQAPADNSGSSKKCGFGSLFASLALVLFGVGRILRFRLSQRPAGGV